MTRLSLPAPGLVALALSLAPAQARAGLFTYSYSGSGTHPGSSLTGSFQVDMAVVAIGVIHLADLQNVSFTFSASGHPDVTFTSFSAIAGAGGSPDGQINVNAQSLPTSQDSLSFPPIINPYGQGSGTRISGIVDFNVSGTFPSDTYDFGYTDSNHPMNNFDAAGGGSGTNWTVTSGPAAVPEPSALALLAAGLALRLRR
jgi:hypothetical protein